MTIPPQNPGNSGNATRAGLSVLAIVLIILGVFAVVGVVVIALLVAILVPSLSRAREASKEVAAMANMRGITVALEMYANDYDARLPSSLAPTLPYGVSPKTLRDPRTGLPPMAEPLPGMSAERLASDVEAHSDYRFVGEGLRISRLSRPSEVPLIIAKTLSRRGEWLIGFADGHVERVRPADLTRYMDELNKARAAEKLPALPAPE